MAETTTTTTITKTTKTKHPQKHQHEEKVSITGEQDTLRKQEAHNLLLHLQKILTEGETPAIDILAAALERVENLSADTARQSEVDPDTRKTLEDISSLLLAARQTAKNKGIADRLQRIAEESQIIVQNKKTGVNTSSRELTQDFVNFMNTWRPIFYLLLSSREFRLLILDSIKIIRRIIYSYTDVTTDTRRQFLEGETAKNMAEKFKEQVREKGAPELTDEEWERIQDDLQRVLIILSREPTYHQGVERIFTFLDMFQNSLTRENTSKGDVLLPQAKDPHIQKVVGETEELVSSFSGREVLEEFKYYLGRLIKKSRDHEEFHTYLHQLKQFILSTKSEEEVQSEVFRKKCRVMAQRGRKLMRQFKEDDDLKPFLRAANTMLDNIRNDEFLQMLRERAGIVQSDLSYVDNEGRVQLDTDMLTNLQKVLLPVLADALKYIPIPKISSSDSKKDFVIDKIVLCSYDIIPENIRFHLETDSEFSLQDIQVRGTHTNLVIQLNQLRTELKDVEFYFKKKTFPVFEDSGRVTLRIKGQGARLALTYNVEQSAGDQLPRILEGHADFDISEMSIEFDKDTLKHNVLIPTMTKLFKSTIKKKIESAVESNMKTFIAKLGSVMSTVLAQLNRPLLSGLDIARKNIRATELSQIYLKRREKLE